MLKTKEHLTKTKSDEVMWFNNEIDENIRSDTDKK